MRLRAGPLFVFVLAAQSIFESTVLQLKGECFAPPSAMICAVAMSRADSGMGVGSSSKRCKHSPPSLCFWVALRAKTQEINFFRGLQVEINNFAFSAYEIKCSQNGVFVKILS